MEMAADAIIFQVAGGGGDRIAKLGKKLIGKHPGRGDIQRGYSSNGVRGFHLQQVHKGNVVMKVWDIGGQPRFRSIWERYCQGVGAILFVVDSSDPSTFPTSKAELFSILSREELKGTPVLVLGNKNDLETHADTETLINELGLTEIKDRVISCYSVSAQNTHNVEFIYSWLIQRV